MWNPKLFGILMYRLWTAIWLGGISHRWSNKNCFDSYTGRGICIMAERIFCIVLYCDSFLPIDRVAKTQAKWGETSCNVLIWSFEFLWSVIIMPERGPLVSWRVRFCSGACSWLSLDPATFHRTASLRCRWKPNAVLWWPSKLFENSLYSIVRT